MVDIFGIYVHVYRTRVHITRIDTFLLTQTRCANVLNLPPLPVSRMRKYQISP